MIPFRDQIKFGQKDPWWIETWNNKIIFVPSDHESFKPSDVEREMLQFVGQIKFGQKYC